MSELRKEAEALGIDVDGRWSDKRLQKEIDAVKLTKEDEQPGEPVDGERNEYESNGDAAISTQPGGKPVEPVKVRNTRGNLLDLKCCEITGFAEAELTAEQMADKRVQRALEIGVLVEV